MAEKTMDDEYGCDLAENAEKELPSWFHLATSVKHQPELGEEMHSLTCAEG
jgi:hypothetical protein